MVRMVRGRLVARAALAGLLFYGCIDSLAQVPPAARPSTLPQLPALQPPPPPPSFEGTLPQQVVAPLLAPGRIIPLRIRNGRAPFTVTIEAGAHRSLFALARAATLQKAPQRSPAATVLDNTVEAGELEGIRFRGVTAGTALPAQIPVSFTVTDALGRAVTGNTVIFPIAPRMSLAGDFPNRIVREGLQLRVTFEGVPAGMSNSLSSKQYEDLTIADTNCYLRVAGPPDPIVADSFGKAVFTVPAAFGARQLEHERGPCTAAFELRVGTSSGTEAHTFRFVQTGITLAQAVIHKVERTSGLQSLFAFSPSNNVFQFDFPGIVGTCSGDSLGIAAVKVGIIDVDGDLAFRIRSGPLGTVCEWRSVAAPLGHKLQLVDAVWREYKVGDKCCSGAVKGCVPLQRADVIRSQAIPVAGDPRWDGSFVDDHGASHVASGFTVAQTFSQWGSSSRIIPMTVRLHCDGTAVNDHEVTLRLESLTLRGPPGSRFP